jgi:phosphohistidine phosphatase
VAGNDDDIAPVEAPVTVYLAHHADAVGPDVDPQRPLSPDGRTHAERIAQRAKECGVTPAAIWHSGKLRARQTAEAYWRACNPLAEFSAIRGLQPTDPPEWIRDRIAEDSIERSLGEGARAVMLVGHMPNLPKVLRLLTGNELAEFPPHGLVALTADAGMWIERFRLL